MTEETTFETTETTSAAGESVTLVEAQQMTSDIVHANLFGAFMICGILVGIALLWRLTK